MKRMKRGHKTLLVWGIIIAVIVLLCNLHNIRYLFLRPYAYESNGYAIGSIINMDGIIYEEINEDTYQVLMKERRLSEDGYQAIGRMGYKCVDDVWKYILYGNSDIAVRRLLVGKNAYILHDANYPEAYFCRQDVLEAWEAEQAE